jgi:hypothetical protein
MRAWKAEIDQHAVAKVLRNVAAELKNDPSRILVEVPENREPILGAKLSEMVRRPDNVAKQNGERPPLITIGDQAAATFVAKFRWPRLY